MEIKLKQLEIEIITICNCDICDILTHMFPLRSFSRTKMVSTLQILLRPRPNFK
jgi:hypothetical protein